MPTAAPKSLALTSAKVENEADLYKLCSNPLVWRFSPWCLPLRAGAEATKKSEVGFKTVRSPAMDGFHADVQGAFDSLGEVRVPDLILASSS